ncbi:MAG: glycosyltransferase [Bryobacteraceae bacterium]|nr:glycosyltransferase [Bryobacteraceae bacterium]
MNTVPRVAFLPDSYHEVNGAARTCRELVAFAERRGYPFLSVRFAKRERFEKRGPLSVLELRRSVLKVPVDPDLDFDLLFYRLHGSLLSRLRAFRPDIIHITSPGDLGILGAVAARQLGVPLALSWHTNLHEFAARRLSRLPAGEAMARAVESFVLNRVVWFFGRGDVLLAPNRELVELLRSRTGKPVFLMARGIDTEAFNPKWRSRTDETFVVGYVGRLQPEKNVRALAEVEQALVAAGVAHYRFSIVGGGAEADWLASNLRRATLHGVLKGEALSRAYADMDVFVFPSRTDTFGNVIQEAHASGLPAVVTDAGGPKFLVDHGVNGFIASSDADLARAVVRLAREPHTLARMREAAALKASMGWDHVFEGVYEAYGAALSETGGNR